MLGDVGGVLMSMFTLPLLKAKNAISYKGS